MRVQSRVVGYVASTVDHPLTGQPMETAAAAHRFYSPDWGRPVARLFKKKHKGKLLSRNFYVRYYDSSGKRIGSASTDSSGTTTNYDARGKVINRESTSGGPTTIYDAGGRNVGRFTTNR